MSNISEPLHHTPLRAFVRNACANEQADDGCLMRSTGCHIVRGLRCGYFERAVLPLALSNPTQYPGVVTAYLKLHPELSGILDPEPTRSCPLCGGPLRKRRRYCDGCAEAKRKAATRARVAKRRAAGPCNALTEKDARIPSETPAFLEPKRPMRGIGQGSPFRAVKCVHPPRVRREERSSAEAAPPRAFERLENR